MRGANDFRLTRVRGPLLRRVHLTAIRCRLNYFLSLPRVSRRTPQNLGKMKKSALFTVLLIVFIDLMGFCILLPNTQYYGQTFGIHNAFLLVLIGPAYSVFQFLFAPILGK